MECSKPSIEKEFDDSMFLSEREKGSIKFNLCLDLDTVIDDLMITPTFLATVFDLPFSSCTNYMKDTYLLPEDVARSLYSLYFFVFEEMFYMHKSFIEYYGFALNFKTAIATDYFTPEIERELDTIFPTKTIKLLKDFRYSGTENEGDLYQTTGLSKHLYNLILTKFTDYPTYTISDDLIKDLFTNYNLSYKLQRIYRTFRHFVFAYVDKKLKSTKPRIGADKRRLI